MPQNLTSADKARLAQEARRRAAEKQRSAGIRPRSRPARPMQGSGASANVNPSPASQSATYAESAASKEALQATVEEEAAADALCETVVTNPSVLGSLAPTVRTLCRNRRRLIATQGKRGVTKASNAVGSSSNAMLASKLLDESTSSRDFAKSRRSAISRMGRGNKPKSRPSRPPRPKVAPPKVEIGTTLSGGSVTGTQVERTTSVTGNESGTCRPVTGTEYVGAEQFSTFCETKPEPSMPKVGHSLTASGSPVSGTEVGRSIKVSGDEQGACQSITGSEYLGTEQFADFCDNQGLTPPKQKVIIGTTQKRQIMVTGSDEFRLNDTTGMEIGADKHITGSQYTDAGSMDLSNYSSGRSVLPSRMERPETSGGSGVTGSEYSAYDAITGSDYSFTSPSFSYSRAAREEASPVPKKVGVDTSCSGQRITGNLVDRSSKVTGNEHGSDRHLTGSQYGRNSCTRPSKAASTHAFAGGRLTGNRVAHDPKINGDGLSGCQPVTGTEVHGLEPLSEHCSSAQAPVSAGMDNTPQAVAPLPAVEAHAHDFTRAVPQQFTAPTGSSYDQQHQQQSVNQQAVQSVSAAETNRVNVSGMRGMNGVKSRNHQVQQQQNQQNQQNQSTPAPVACDTQPKDEESKGGASCGCCAAKTLAEQAGLLNNVQANNTQTLPQANHTQPQAQSIPAATTPTPAPVMNQPPVMEQQAVAPIPTPTYVAEQPPIRQPMMQSMAQQHIGHDAEQSIGGVITGSSNLGTGLLSGTPESRYPQQLVQSTANVPIYNHGHNHASQVNQVNQVNQVSQHGHGHGHGHSHAHSHAHNHGGHHHQVAPMPVHVPQPQYAQPYGYPNLAATPQLPAEMQQQQQNQQQDMSSRRITGEGRDDGLPITGDNWKQGDQVTGTEGRWAQARNPTLQVDSRMTIPGAHTNKGVEREITSPASMTSITGSSGSRDSGPHVTVSGGARG